MTDFLVDPLIGKTTYKIDPSTKNINTLWPSSKYVTKECQTGKGGTLLATGYWNLTDNNVVQNIVIPVDGLYQITVKHWFKNAFGQPIPIQFNINGGALQTMGWVYYSGTTDVGVFLSLKKGDIFKLYQPYTYYNLNTISYSSIDRWMIRRIK
jgi:hypothetical protein